MAVVLVINSGSSSFKYQLIDLDTEATLVSGLIERIGSPIGHGTHKVVADGETVVFEQDVPIPDHTAGFGIMLGGFAAHGPDLTLTPPVAVGHRVVHGGQRFFAPTLVTDRVEQDIDELSALAPLHNPGALQGVRAARAAFSDLPHVASFDTAFHQTLSPAAYTYAIDADLAARHRVRRYGFHGTSHKFVSEQAAAFLGRQPEGLNLIVLHLGNGASAAAIKDGRSVETSMGMTPLEGLVMGTRSGDIDPAVLVHLHRQAGLDIGELDELLNRRSGLLGLSGRSDMRDVQEAASAGDAAAQLALDVYHHRIRGYVGSYLAQLGRLDAIVFTAGVGENSPEVRAGSLGGLERLGITVDPTRNESSARGPRRISPDESPVAVLVIPTNEELEIARQAIQVVDALA